MALFSACPHCLGRRQFLAGGLAAAATATLAARRAHAQAPAAPQMTVGKYANQGASVIRVTRPTYKNNIKNAIVSSFPRRVSRTWETVEQRNWSVARPERDSASY